MTRRLAGRQTITGCDAYRFWKTNHPWILLLRLHTYNLNMYEC